MPTLPTKTTAEYRAEADLPAIAAVLGSGVDLTVVPGVLGREWFNEITREELEYEILCRTDDEACGLIRQHMDQWSSAPVPLPTVRESLVDDHPDDPGHPDVPFSL